MLGGDGWDAPELFTIGGDALNGSYFSNHFAPDQASPQAQKFVADFKAKYGPDRVTSDPMESAYTAVYLWKATVEKADSFAVADIQSAADGVTVDAPEGSVTIDGENHHVTKTARVGKVVDLELDADDPEQARAQVQQMCEQLLANPLIESYEIEFRGQG